ncbi:MAG: DUF3365 domain-containing protein [Nitrospirae bacterium]|nr:DUF3365 domain-containing protein [Nitrospirota bacterium]MCL5977318.1 DUF3365 domain-containing protein [Nitrospirota bacterium]
MLKYFMGVKKFSLGLRFSLTVGVILFLFCALFSTILYHYLKAQVIKDAEDKTMIIMTQVKALGGYVKDSLRPRMFDILKTIKSENEFIIEAMSTTHVNLQVMERFNKDLPEYVYKRVSDKPLNTENTADTFHLGMIGYFTENRNKQSWQGIVKIDEQESLVYTRSIISDHSCLRCHGSPGKVPKAIFVKYGKSGNFGWKENMVVGVESVSIPMNVAFAHVRKVAIDTFMFGISTLGLLFLVLYGTFRHIVTRPLNNLSGIFRGIARGTEPLGREIPSNRKDEIGDLTESFNILARHLLEAQEKLKKAAEIEKQMMETEKLAALGQLSAGVAHEINNPLGGIRLCFNNLMNTGMDVDTKRRHIEVINSGLDRIQNIVKHLLDVSKNSPLNIASSSIDRIIENVLALTEYIISKKGIKIVKNLSCDVPELMVDSNKLEQVFLNLIINAAQAMDGEGVLTIGSFYEAGMCNVSVTDTGKGIPYEIVGKIFDPFFTTKGVGEGTGLGLTMSKAIVEQHGGEIAVETSDKGTTFTVILPLTQ